MAPLRLALAADLAEVARLTEAADGFATAAGMDKEAIARLLTVLDETVTNVVMYGRLGEDERIEVTLASPAGGGVEVAMEDPGPAYDPLANARQPELDATLEERAVGGLGVYLVLQLTTSAAYSRTAQGRNRLTFRVG